MLLAVGGNHEASNHLWELYHGGWVAPNIYYLGHAGVVNFGGARIAGLSGIFNDRHYRMVRCCDHSTQALQAMAKPYMYMHIHAMYTPAFPTQVSCMSIIFGQQ